MNIRKKVLEIAGKNGHSLFFYDLKSLIPVYEKSLAHSPARLRVIKETLNDLAERTSGHRAHGLVCASIFILNQVHGTKLKAIARSQDPSKRHTITDHAFVRGLERYFDVDMLKAKDRMLEIAQSENWHFIKKDGRIVTFSPEDEPE